MVSPHSSLRFLLLLLLINFCLCLAELTPRQSCSSGYYLCSPDGASTRDVPEIGPGLARLYLNLIETVNPQPAPAHLILSVDDSAPAHRVRQTPGDLCCAETTQCLLVLSYSVPLCWDKFTTDYYLPDGSYGSITSGNYTTPNGDQANLVTGNYRLANGQTGNIYQGDSLAEPNTSSLPIPTPWTSSGVGSAIPASEVGAQPSSNSTGMPLLPTPTTASATITTSSSVVTSHIIASAPSTSRPVSNVTTLSGGSILMTSSNVTPTTATETTQPEITPPITNSAMMHACHGLRVLWLMLTTFAIFTYLVMH